MHRFAVVDWNATHLMFALVNNEGIWVHAEHSVLWLKVNGRGSFQNAHFLKDLLEDALAHRERITSACIDLSQCTGLDSTFLGALAGMAIQIKKCGGTTTIFGASGRNRELLENMGLNLLVTLKENSEMPCWQTLRKHNGSVADKESAAAIMLEAHETLAELSQKNQTQFQNVIDYLRKRAAKQNSLT